MRSNIPRARPTKRYEREAAKIIASVSRDAHARCIHHEFELWQGDMMVAKTVAANRSDALHEIQHYAAVYSQDGPVEIRERGKKL